jgi:hypothetical protein
MSERPSPTYLAVVVGLMAVAPLASIAVEIAAFGGAFWPAAAKWFAFWACGIRLALAGARQTLQPAFTAKEIFGVDDAGALPMVQEIGFANLSFGLTGIASLVFAGWRPAAIFVAGLYYGFAALGHMQHPPRSGNERLALISDVGIFVVLAGILAMNAGVSYQS